MIRARRLRDLFWANQQASFLKGAKSMPITAEQADRVLKASKLKATELGISVCIAILDAGGHLKAFHRMDGAWLGVIDVAIKKATTSALFEMETQILDNYSRAGADAHGIELSNGNLITFAGGIPLRSVDGQVIGSIGVSGGQVAQDYAIAQSGQSALHA
jgi:uncharacterized protein GlcG (DUF336 family)